jgi:hypothetical protein
MGGRTMRGTHLQALQPFLDRAGRGAPEVCSRGDAGTLGAGGCSCGVGCVMPCVRSLIRHAYRESRSGVEWSGWGWSGGRGVCGVLHCAHESGRYALRNGF